MELSHQKTVLIVDDDRNILMALDKRLSAAGFRVLAASNAIDALEFVRQHRVDAVALDVVLPGPLDGISLATALRKQPATAEVPIIFVTGAADGNFRERSKQAGAQYFVSKPYDDELLIRLLHSIFGQDDLAEAKRISQAKRRQPVWMGNRRADQGSRSRNEAGTML